MANPEQTLKGILVRDTKTFYYQEGSTSNYSVNNLILQLLHKRIIKEGKNPTDYTVISLHQAKIEKYTIVPLFESKHAKQVFETETKKGDVW